MAAITFEITIENDWDYESAQEVVNNFMNSFPDSPEATIGLAGVVIAEAAQYGQVTGFTAYMPE